MKLKRSWQLMLTSDKPVYQPGQVIRLRSLALARPELKPVAGHAVAYAIRDPKGNVIFRKRDVTSRFGIASADCPLADEIAEGAYQVECQVGDTMSTATVEVKKYALPKFKIEHVARPALLRAGPEGPRHARRPLLLRQTGGKRRGGNCRRDSRRGGRQGEPIATPHLCGRRQPSSSLPYRKTSSGGSSFPATPRSRSGQRQSIRPAKRHPKRSRGS